MCESLADNDVDVDTAGELDGGDSLDLIVGALQIDVALVDAHFEGVPGLGTYIEYGKYLHRKVFYGS